MRHQLHRRARALAMALALVPAAVHGGEPILAPGSPVAVGKGPGGLAVADVNADGALDLVVTNGGSRDVSVLLGNGRGGFSPAPGTPLSVPVAPHLAVVGDLDGDGRADIAVTGHDSHGVWVWLANAQGRFAVAPGSPFAVLAGGRPHNHGLALGDLDGDGDLDIATTDDVVHAVPVLLNDGKAGFRPAPGSPFAVGREPYPLVLADVNGDQRLDAVTPDVRGASVSVLLGDGKAGFRPAPGSPVAVTARPYFVATGDVNGDGTLDVVATHDDASVATVLLGDGRGGLRPAAGSPLDMGRRGWKAVLHDMDRDGKRDLVVGAGDAVMVLLGDGRGGFRPAPGSPFAAGHGWSIGVGDFDGDGKADVVGADSTAGAVTFLLGR